MVWIDADAFAIFFPLGHGGAHARVAQIARVLRESFGLFLNYFGSGCL
jgi:hypothetical protein